MLNYPVEYLNEVNWSGMPLAKLQLKVGCPVIILKNLDPGNGVCNGSRVIVTQCRSRVLEVELLTGDHKGKRVFIPRISNTPTKEQVAFKFIRKQFPIRVCFVMMINKSQGQTVKHIGQDLWSPVFTHGQFRGNGRELKVQRAEGFVFDQVWLEGTHIHTHHPTQKLRKKRYGPFTIEEKMSGVTYRLKLLNKWKIHPVFHIDLLTKYREMEIHGKNYSPPPPDIVDR